MQRISHAEVEVPISSFLPTAMDDRATFDRRGNDPAVIFVAGRWPVACDRCGYFLLACASSHGIHR
ncbi:hypothetical protein L1277_002756 [Okibacterium sp. HSC-33S16]|nr:hypothetical protein [Okibacterium sp. HSC-33S16]